MKKPNYQEEILKNRNTTKLLSIFSEFIKITQEVLFKFNETKNPPTYAIVFQNLLQRLLIGIDAINNLFGRFNTNNYFKHPVALIMRTCSLDSLTIAYLSLYIDQEDPQKFENEITKLNQPIARQLNEEIQEMIKKGNTNRNIIAQIVQLYPDNFDYATKIPKLKKIKDIRPKEMSLKLKGTPLNWYSNIYKQYQHFSIFEHYSPISKKLLDLDGEYEFDNIVYTAFYILHAAYIAMMFMRIDNMYTDEMKKLRDSITEIERQGSYRKIKSQNKKI